MTRSSDLFPPEIWFKVLLYLDIPDLDALGLLSPYLHTLTVDTTLHRTRLFVVAPSRLDYFLFVKSCLRPSILDLVNRDVMRGLQIERRWRTGAYLYSPQSVRQYETSRQLARARVQDVLASYISCRRRKLASANRLVADIESSLPKVSRTLIPIVRKLKWCIQRDRVSQIVQSSHSRTTAHWISTVGQQLLHDRVDERTRLALCPGTRKLIKLFEASPSNC